MRGEEGTDPYSAPELTEHGSIAEITGGLELGSGDLSLGIVGDGSQS